MRLFTQRVSLIFFETEIMMKHGGYVGNISKWLQVAPTLFHEVKPGFAEGVFYGFPMGNPPFGVSSKESEHFLFSIIYGISSFPLTFIFFRWVETTNQRLCFFRVI